MPVLSAFDLTSFLSGFLFAMLLLSFWRIDGLAVKPGALWLDRLLMVGYLFMAGLAIYEVLGREFGLALVSALLGLVFLRAYWQRKFAALELEEKT